MNSTNEVQPTNTEILEDVRDIRLTTLIDMLHEKEILTDDEVFRLNP